MATFLPPRSKPPVEWLGGYNDGEHIHVEDYELNAGFVRLPDPSFYEKTVKATDPPEEFSKKAPMIVYPIRRYSVINAITRRRYEKLMIDYYAGVVE